MNVPGDSIDLSDKTQSNMKSNKKQQTNQLIHSQSSDFLNEARAASIHIHNHTPFIA